MGSTDIRHNLEMQIADIQRQMADRVNPLTQAYLRSFGIDPHEIPVDGWDRQGYQTFVRNDKGLKIPIGDTTKRMRHDWPENFNYNVMLALWAADEPTRSGIRV